MRVLVSGSRSWDRPDVIWECLDILASEAAAEGVEQMVVLHGCALGVDMHADKWVRRGGHPLDVRVERFPADWTTGDRAAGLKRNLRMLETQPDVVLAFIRDQSRGATHCANAAESADIPVLRIDYDSLPERPE